MRRAAVTPRNRACNVKPPSPSPFTANAYAERPCSRCQVEPPHIRRVEFSTSSASRTSPPKDKPYKRRSYACAVDSGPVVGNSTPATCTPCVVRRNAGSMQRRPNRAALYRRRHVRWCVRTPQRHAECPNPQTHTNHTNKYRMHKRVTGMDGDAHAAMQMLCGQEVASVTQTQGTHECIEGSQQSAAPRHAAQAGDRQKSEFSHGARTGSARRRGRW